MPPNLRSGALALNLLFQLEIDISKPIKLNIMIVNIMLCLILKVDWCFICWVIDKKRGNQVLVASKLTREKTVNKTSFHK